MMSKIYKLAGLSVNYTNHSLRATSASRMFTSGVPEKIGAEFTGHKSLTSLRQYERTTETQLQAAGQSIARMEEYTQKNVQVSKIDEEQFPQRFQESNKAALRFQELQKSMISGNLQNCNISFNF